MRDEHWPLFGLAVSTPRITLRYIDDELAHQLVALAADGIHDPATMPFLIPWTDLPSPQLEREAFRFYWRSRAETRPDAWRLLFAAVIEGRVIGACDLAAEQFPTLRQFETGSWLTPAAQGRGIGTEMREAALHLGFVGLGADVATTGAWSDNHASLGVTRKLGYREEGRRRAIRRDAPDEIIGFRMDRAHFDSMRRDDIDLIGVDAARDFLEIGRV